MVVIRQKNFVIVSSPVQEGDENKLQIVPERVHFIGIGGAGMSGLARILLELGYHVSGSDLAVTAVTKRLQSMGAACYTGHAEENVQDTQMVVVSTAIKPDNPELVAAGEKGLPVIHRSELLSLLMKRQKGVAVAGAHGKTTTTSMLAFAMEKNGLDPTIVVGGELTNIGGNAKLGRGEYLIAEADESDGSFLNLEPVAAIITNIEDDHLDHYGSLEKIKEAFSQFLKKLPKNGLAVVCADDANVLEVIADYDGPLITYAINNPNADYILKDCYLNGLSSYGEVYYRGKHLGRLELTVPGIHNLSNALSVVAVCLWAGLSMEQIASAMKEFRGAGRRFQLLGEVRGIKVVDDYAHHPTEIKATLSAARQTKPGRLISVFQPHRYTRTHLLKEQFGEAFNEADLIIINDIYSAGESPIEGVTARSIIDEIKKHSSSPVVYLETKQEIVEYLADQAVSGDLIMTMGAGNIWTAGVDLVKRLKES